MPVYNVVMLTTFVLIDPTATLPYLSSNVKEMFDKSHKELAAMRRYLQTTITALKSDQSKLNSILENQVDTLKSSIRAHFGKTKTSLVSVGVKINQLERELKALGQDLKSKFLFFKHLPSCIINGLIPCMQSICKV